MLPFEDNERLLAHLRGRLGGCPSCGEHDWFTHDEGRIYLVVTDPATRARDADKEHLPVATVICKHCYLVLQYALKPILGGT